MEGHTMRATGRQRIARWVAVASLAAAVALVTLNMQQSEELRADVLLQGTALPMLDQVTKMVGYAPSGISYGEGQMPLGLGAASGICDHGYCPQEGEGVEINPREVPTSPFAVRWDGFNWDTMDDDVNVFQPPDSLAKHLAGDESSCGEKDAEPCDKWGDGRHPHPEMRPYPIPPPVPASDQDAGTGALHGEETSKGVSTSYESYPGEWEKDAGTRNHGEESHGEYHYVHDVGGDNGHDGYDGKTIHDVGGDHGPHGEYHYVHDVGGDQQSWGEHGDGADYSFSDPGHPGPKGSWSSPLDQAEKFLSQQVMGARRGRASGASHSGR
jgi:hypothetical protein